MILKKWQKFDNYMQDWYRSIPHPLNDFVMTAIGLCIAVIVFTIIMVIRIKLL